MADTPTKDPLADDMAYFDAHRIEWADKGHEGAWAVVKNGTLLGFYKDLAAGYHAGALAFGSVPFVLERVAREIKPAILHRIYFSRPA